MSWPLSQARLCPSISHSSSKAPPHSLLPRHLLQVLLGSCLEGITSDFKEHANKNENSGWAPLWKVRRVRRQIQSLLILVGVSYFPLFCGMPPNFPWFTICVTLGPAGPQKPSSQAPPSLCPLHSHHCHLPLPFQGSPQPHPLTTAARMKSAPQGS